MPNMVLTFVPDSNFFIAAINNKGYCRTYLYESGNAQLGCKFVTSEAILLEVQAIIENKFGTSRARAVRAIQDIRNIATIVHPSVKVEFVRDTDDNKILECALECHADMVLSFDKDLLSLKEFEGIKIVHPSMLKYLFPKKNN